MDMWYRKIWENIVSLRKNCPTQFIVIWIIISFILGCMRKRINYRQVLLKSWHWRLAISSKKYEKYHVLYSVSNHELYTPIIVFRIEEKIASVQYPMVHLVFFAVDRSIVPNKRWVRSIPWFDTNKKIFIQMLNIDHIRERINIRLEWNKIRRDYLYV